LSFGELTTTKECTIEKEFATVMTIREMVLDGDMEEFSMQ
jgi:hypothetical protein